MDGTTPDRDPAPQVSDPYLTPFGNQNYSQILKNQIEMATYQRLRTGIATAMQGQGNFGGYSSAAMQAYQAARYHEMQMRKAGLWNSAVVTATAGYMPSYLLDGDNNAYQTVERAAEVETVPPTVYVTKRLNCFMLLWWMPIALFSPLIPLIWA